MAEYHSQRRDTDSLSRHTLTVSARRTSSAIIVDYSDIREGKAAGTIELPDGKELSLTYKSHRESITEPVK